MQIVKSYEYPDEFRGIIKYIFDDANIVEEHLINDETVCVCVNRFTHEDAEALPQNIVDYLSAYKLKPIDLVGTWYMEVYRDDGFLWSYVSEIYTVKEKKVMVEQTVYEPV